MNMSYGTNIASVFSQAQPSDWTAGMEWYPLAHSLAQRIAASLNVSVAQAAYAIAALSPRTSWPENVRAITAIAQHLADGGQFGDFSVTPSLRVTHINQSKAFAILTTGDLAYIGNGPKTRAFADNILNPGTSQMVTIDSWAYRIAAGMINVTDEVPVSIRGKVYDEVAAAYIEVASFSGLLPLELQAITWVTAHRLENKPL